MAGKATARQAGFLDPRNISVYIIDGFAFTIDLAGPRASITLGLVMPERTVVRRRIWRAVSLYTTLWMALHCAGYDSEGDGKQSE